MKILITGSSGFLGKALSNKLSKKGLDFIKVTRQNIKGSTIVANYKETPDADIIIHLAQSNDRHFVNSQNSSYIKENLEIVDDLIKKTHKKFIYISSASVYGDKIKTPRKTIEKIEPYDIYSHIKLESENIVLKKNGTILRLSNIYGPEMSKKNVISKIIEKVSSEKVIKVNNGYSIRDFIWVDDVIEAIIKVIKLELQSSIFNVGSGNSISIRELINNIQLVFKKNLPVKFENDKGLSSIILDISDTKSKLKWEPRVNIIEGLSTIIKFRNL